MNTWIRPTLTLAAALLFVLFAEPAPAGPLESCQGTKLKAAGAAAKKVVACFAKAAKKSDGFDRGEIEATVSSCGEAQLAKLERSWVKAEAKGGAECEGAGADRVLAAIDDALAGALEVALAGLSNPATETQDKGSKKLLGSLLKAAGNYGKKWIGAEDKVVKKGDVAKRDASRAKARTKKDSSWDKAGSKAARSGVDFALPAPARRLDEAFGVVIDLIVFEKFPPPVLDDDFVGLPTLLVDPPTPSSGAVVTLSVDAPGALSIGVAGAGDGCGNLGVPAGVSGDFLVLADTVADFGLCELAAAIIYSDRTEFEAARFTIEPIDLVLPDIQLVGGVYVAGDLPPASGTPEDPAIASVDAPSTLITGGVARLRIRLQDPSQAEDITSLGVQIGGGSGGHFQVPALVVGDEVLADVRLSETSAGGVFHTILLQLRNVFGAIGQVFSVDVGTQEVGTGDVQVSVSWDSATDVDLHVVEPGGGEEIYFGNTASASGGLLDLDSNAGCSIDSINNENITWPVGTAPEGEYVVRVNFWSDCDTAGANYTVTTNVCGETKTFPGSFSQGESTGGGLGAGTEITRFDVDCSVRVRGTARYDDLAQTTNPGGFNTVLAVPLPIRFADVEIVRESDGALLAEDETAQDGSFDVRFRNDGPAGYRVVVQTSRDSSRVKQRVEDAQGSVYELRSDVIDETAEPDKTGLQLVAAEDETGPAFNIFDVGVAASVAIRTLHGRAPPFLTWRWTRGQAGLCGPTVSCYTNGTIYVTSSSVDQDEYDDTNLLHEYGHHWQQFFTRTMSPGGAHSLGMRYTPRLSWGEGSATFFGNLVKGTSMYIDATYTGLRLAYDIEKLDPRIPTDTSDGTDTGDINEAVVSAILWDLADPANEETPLGADTVTRRPDVFSALGVMKSLATDRGVAGADLIDFLDGWFCLGHGDQGSIDSGVQGILNTVSIFYDYAPQPACR